MGKQKGVRSATVLTGGALGASLAASVCCAGPVVLALLGLGGAGLLLKLAPYRPFFLGVTALLLAGAFYLTYRRPHPESCVPGSACSAPGAPTRRKVLIWVVAAVAFLAAAFPYLAEVLF
jgi:mercuric ion transport protein